jgi:hypothetical protein
VTGRSQRRRVALFDGAGLAWLIVLQAPQPSSPVAAPAARPARRRGRRLFAVGAAALVLAGCSNSNEPKNYNADVERNFLEACSTANEGKKDLPDATAFCECVWTAVRENFEYDEFKALDNTLRERVGDEKNTPQNAKDVEAINAEYVTLVEGCRTAGPAPTS